MPRRVIPKAAGWHWDQKERHVRPDGLPSCRFCKGAVHPPKKTFCGPVCVSEWKRRTSWQLTRLGVYARAKGRCALCTFDLTTVDVERFLKQLRLGEEFGQIPKAKWAAKLEKPETDGNGDLYPRRYWLDRIEYGMEWKRRNKVVGRDGWEADHVVPVSVGGDWFDFKNLQLLCISCHRSKTAKEATRRAFQKRKIAT